MSIKIHNHLKKIVGSNSLLKNQCDMTPYATEWRGLLSGKPSAVVFPASAEQISEIVKLCSSNCVSVVPQGGNTGLCGGATPDKSNEQIVISMKKFNKINNISVEDYSIEAQAGCTLELLQNVAKKNKCIFPIDMSSSGTCQIGGNISTNAGGSNVLKYGTTRSNVLGLEVVLPNGQILRDLSTLKKNTAGYDLKHLFIGAEGTLGIITAATMKIYPVKNEIMTALIGVNSPNAVSEIFHFMKSKNKPFLETFEIFSKRALGLVKKNMPNVKIAINCSYQWYILAEMSLDTNECFENQLSVISSLYNDSEILIAKNNGESLEFWMIRDAISESQQKEGITFKHDISVPLSKVFEFISRAEREVIKILPKARIIPFGHFGDGSIHFNVTQPLNMNPKIYKTYEKQISSIIYDVTKDLNGSISSEHGIGLFKKSYLRNYKSKSELDLMRLLKLSIDPKNIMNPNKII